MVQSDGVQPGKETLGYSKTRQPPKRLFEYILNRILRLLTLPEHPVCQGVQEGSVSFYDCFKGRWIAVQGSLNRQEILGICVFVTFRNQTISPLAVHLSRLYTLKPIKRFQ